MKNNISESTYWNWKDSLKDALSKDGTYESCSEPGVDASDAVKALAVEYGDYRETMPVEWVRNELRECGAWDTEELADDDANFERMIWMFSNDIREESRGKT